MDLSSFDWPKWHDLVWHMLRHGAGDFDYSTTLVPLFRAAPPPPDDEMILINARNCCGWNEDLRDFYFNAASREPENWNKFFKWGTSEIMFALETLERDMNRLPMREYFDIPDDVATTFDRFKTTREQALVLFHDDAFPKDGDKAIRTRVAKFLITKPVEWEFEDVVGGPFVVLDNNIVLGEDLSSDESGDESDWSSDESEL